MVAVGDPKEENLHVVVHADAIPIFAGKMSDAVLMLVTSYFVFDINWPKIDKLALLFRTSIIIPEKMKNEITKKNNNFNCVGASGLVHLKK